MISISGTEITIIDADGLAEIAENLTVDLEG